MKMSAKIISIRATENIQQPVYIAYVLDLTLLSKNAMYTAKKEIKIGNVINAAIVDDLFASVSETALSIAKF